MVYAYDLPTLEETAFVSAVTITMSTVSPCTTCIITDVRGNMHPAQLSITMQSLLSWLGELARRGAMAQPEMLSACRSLEQQKMLQRNWDRGMKEGIAVRPVDKSAHLPDPMGRCHAFDLANDTHWLQVMGRVVSQKWPNIEWGGRFFPADPRHFEERTWN